MLAASTSTGRLAGNRIADIRGVAVPALLQTCRNPCRAILPGCRFTLKLQHVLSYRACDVIPDDGPVKKTGQKRGCLKIVNGRPRNLFERLAQFVGHETRNPADKRWQITAFCVG